MERNKMVINLAGQEFRISAGNDEEYMRGLEEGVNKRIKQIKARYPNESTTRCMLLAMLETEDELKKLSAESKEVDRKIRELREFRGNEEKPAARTPVKRPFERKKTTET
jgi:cell division protein ZapA (FtsZ GTPase activity inhibitor)